MGESQASSAAATLSVKIPCLESHHHFRFLEWQRYILHNSMTSWDVWDLWDQDQDKENVKARSSWVLGISCFSKEAGWTDPAKMIPNFCLMLNQRNLLSKLRVHLDFLVLLRNPTAVNHIGTPPRKGRKQRNYIHIYIYIYTSIIQILYRCIVVKLLLISYYLFAFASEGLGSIVPHPGLRLCRRTKLRFWSSAPMRRARRAAMVLPRPGEG